MRHHKIPTAMLIALAVLLTAPPPSSAQGQAPRTLIEAIDISTPDATTLAFATAFSRSDYFAASFLLTVAAKSGFQDGMQRREGVRDLFPASDGTVPGAAMFQTDGAFIEDQSLDFSRLFDDVMIHAEGAGLLPFRIAAGANARLVETGHGRFEAVFAQGVTLHLVQVAPDRWLVDRISFDGATGEDRPWRADTD